MPGHTRRTHTALGAKLGTRLAHLMAQGMTSHLRSSLNVRARTHAAGLNEFWHQVGSETRTHFAPYFEQALEHLPTDHPARPMIEFMLSGRGEAQAMSLLMSAGWATAGAFSSGLADLVYPLNRSIMHDHPNQNVPASVAAGLVAKGIIDSITQQEEGHDTGFNQMRNEWLHQAAIEFPDVPMIAELQNRGIIDDSAANLAMHRNGYAEPWRDWIRELRRLHLSPADAALAVLRSEISEDSGRRTAGLSGMHAGDFDVLVANTGEPPGLESLLMAYRRGFIDRPRLARGVRQSRVRNEWEDVIERLRFEPMSTADAVNAAIRNYIHPDRAARIAAENGLEPSNFPWLLESAGRPPGPMQTMELWNRGAVTEAEVDQAIRESDMKDKYIPHIKHLRYRIPAERLVITMVQHGAMTTKRAQQLLREAGYQPDVAQSIVQAGVSQRHQATKQVSLGNVLELYRDHAISEARATDMIVSLGHPKADAPILLATERIKQERAWRDQAASATRSAYLAHHITASEAHAELAAEGFAADEVDRLLRLWAIELRGRRKELTEAQVISAYAHGVIPPADAITRLERSGYAAEDARVLVETARRQHHVA